MCVPPLTVIDQIGETNQGHSCHLAVKRLITAKSSHYPLQIILIAWCPQMFAEITVGLFAVEPEGCVVGIL